jgi:hypothetical protein
MREGEPPEVAAARARSFGAKLEGFAPTLLLIDVHVNVVLVIGFFFFF